MGDFRRDDLSPVLGFAESDGQSFELSPSSRRLSGPSNERMNEQSAGLSGELSKELSAQP
jgi:hypothetical protein